MFVKGDGLHKLKIKVYTKLISNLVDCCLLLRCFSSKKPKNTFLKKTFQIPLPISSIATYFPFKAADTYTQ
jgi:hypothetical protein